MPPEIWEQQCEAALQIRDDYGWWKAVGYLVGEKFLNALRPRSPLSEDALNEFAARIREVIPRGELESYFKNVSRVGALGHVMDDASYREVGGQMEDAKPTDFAADVILLEKAKKLLLG